MSYLIHTGDLEKAEIFSLMTLDSLKDPANKVNQISDEVARGYYNLAKVISAQVIYFLLLLIFFWTYAFLPVLYGNKWYKFFDILVCNLHR
jgi:hypothetical protein